MPYTENFADGDGPTCHNQTNYQRSVSGADAVYPEMIQCRNMKTDTIGGRTCATKTAGGFWRDSGHSIDYPGTYDPDVEHRIDTYYYMTTASLADCAASAGLPPFFAIRPAGGAALIQWENEYTGSGETFDVYLVAQTFPSGSPEDMVSTSWTAYKDAWQKLSVVWKPETADNAGDGYVRAYVNDTVFLQLESIGLNRNVVVTHFTHGNQGLMGSVTDINVGATAGDMPTDSADVCGCSAIEPSDVVAGGGQGAGAVPTFYPIIGQQAVCTGGGTVPTQADLTFSETWWGQ